MDADKNSELMAVSYNTDLTKADEMEISPYDSSYPIRLLYDGLRLKLEQSQEIAERIYRKVLSVAPIGVQIRDATKTGVRYVVDASEEMLKKLDTGELKFEVTKTGKMTAQLKNGNVLGEKVPIKREDIRKGIDPNEMLHALQMKAIEEQLQDIADQIALIDSNVKDVLQGQQNDRIALYHSGLRLFLESQSVKDGNLKNALLAQALKTLSDSSYQLAETMKSDVRYLTEHAYSSARGKRIELINERISSINKSFEFIHQASMLRAAIYCKENEMIAMTSVLEEYSHFIDSTIVSNAQQLAVLDPNDNGSEDGIWKTRMNLKIDMSNISKRLNCNEGTLYIAMEGE